MVHFPVPLYNLNENHHVFWHMILLMYTFKHCLNKQRVSLLSQMFSKSFFYICACIEMQNKSSPKIVRNVLIDLIII